jgi:hypothetical protein
MWVVVAALAQVAYIVLPATAAVAALKGWRVLQSPAPDWSELRSAWKWLGFPWLIVALLTGLSGIEELLEDAADGNPVFLSPLVALFLAGVALKRRLSGSS